MKTSTLFALFIIVMAVSGCAPAQSAVPTPPPPTAAATSVPLTPTPIPPSATPTDKPLPTTGKIEGRFSQADTDQPIVNTSIYIFPLDNNVAIKATVNEQGNFSFDELEPGTYKLTFALAFADQSAIPCEYFNIEAAAVKGGQSIFYSDAHPVLDGVTLGASKSKFDFIDEGITFFVMAREELSQKFDIGAGDMVQMDLKLKCR